MGAYVHVKMKQLCVEEGVRFHRAFKNLSKMERWKKLSRNKLMANFKKAFSSVILNSFYH